MTQPLTSFWPIFSVKSDGLDVVNQKGRVLRNGPTQEQLDRTPNEQGQCDYYRLIEKDDPKHIDWRKKLGGMLLREIGGKQHEGGLEIAICKTCADQSRQVAASHPVGVPRKLQAIRAHQDKGRWPGKDGQESLRRRTRPTRRLSIWLPQGTKETLQEPCRFLSTSPLALH